MNSGNNQAISDRQAATENALALHLWHFHDIRSASTSQDRISELSHDLQGVLNDLIPATKNNDDAIVKPTALQRAMQQTEQYAQGEQVNMVPVWSGKAESEAFDIRCYVSSVHEGLVLTVVFTGLPSCSSAIRQLQDRWTKTSGGEEGHLVESICCSHSVLAGGLVVGYQEIMDFDSPEFTSAEARWSELLSPTDNVRNFAEQLISNDWSISVHNYGAYQSALILRGVTSDDGVASRIVTQLVPSFGLSLSKSYVCLQHAELDARSCHGNYKKLNDDCAQIKGKIEDGSGDDLRQNLELDLRLTKRLATIARQEFRVRAELSNYRINQKNAEIIAKRLRRVMGAPENDVAMFEDSIGVNEPQAQSIEVSIERITSAARSGRIMLDSVRSNLQRCQVTYARRLDFRMSLLIVIQVIIAVVAFIYQVVQG